MWRTKLSMTKNMGSQVENRLRFAILQRVCTNYRKALFTQISLNPEVETIIFIGEDVPNSKVKNGSDLSNIHIRKLKTRFIHLGSRVLPWHIGLVSELRKFHPEVILCEGESHFLGYIQAICYKYLFNRRVALMHHCYISLPGWKKIGGSGPRAYLKNIFRRFFAAFVVYSSYSKECLMNLGQPSEKIFVATNVGDTQKFLIQSDSLKIDASEARRQLKLPDRFTVLYLGTLDANKRPEIVLELAKKCASECFNFVLLGSGPLLETLRGRVENEGLSNVYLPGRISDKLPQFFRASDVLLVPGRGGIIISEAMANSLPVIIHHGDGTEYDLVQNEVTGFRLSCGSVEDFRNALEFLRNNPIICARMGAMGRQLVTDRFNTNNMVKQIIVAAKYALKARI